MNTFESEQLDELDVNHDDVHVLRELLHSIKGISPISGNVFELVPIPDEEDIQF